MRVCVIGSGLAGLASAFHLSAYPGLTVTVFEQDSHFGGRADVDGGGEHCPRFFLDDYEQLFEIMHEIEDNEGRTLHDALRQVRRLSHVGAAGWVEISHLYRLFAKEIPWSERLRVARSWRPTPLVADQRRARSANRYGSLRNYSIRPLLRMGRGVFRSKTGYVLPGSTEEYLVSPWVRHLRSKGVTLHADTRIKTISSGPDGVAITHSGGTGEYDAVIVTACVPDLVNLLNASGIDHTVTDTEQIHCMAFTIDLDPREAVFGSSRPSFYSRGGVHLLVQPAHCRAVVLCTGSASTRQADVISRVREFLELEHEVVAIRERKNHRPGEAVYGGDSLRADRILRRPLDRIYFAGSHVRNSYPIDSAESAVRSANNAVRLLSRDFALGSTAGLSSAGVR